jgi:ubiquinone/menaquinone biosynthesis C-methylase UbiE
MSLTKSELIHLYGQRALRYDLTANLYYLLGFREWAYRRKAVRALNLSPGDTVVEIGCGTGLNFSLLEREVGPQGRIIGVDLTEAMLEQARERVRRMGWRNVELVRSDAASYAFPRGINGVVSTFALTLVPEFDQVISNAAGALSERGRFVILDFKQPSNIPQWLVKLAVCLTKPFGVSLDLASRHPWEALERYLDLAFFEEVYFGFSYVTAGQKRASEVTNRAHEQ